jgi:hypothetical protein
MTSQRDIGPLQAQVQEWWDAQHASHQPTVDPLGRPYSGIGQLESIFNQGEFVENIQLCPMLCAWRNGRSREELVATLRPYLKARAVQTSELLSTPDAQVAREIASTLLPAPFGEELNVVTDLIQAAGAQTLQQRDRALLRAAAGGVVLLGFFAFIRGSAS